MSLILDALNKADRERQATEAPPGIHTMHDTQEFKPGKPIWFYVTIAAFTLFVLILAGFWFLRDPPAPVSAPATPAASSAPVVSSPEPESVATAVPAVDPTTTTLEEPKKSTRIPGLPKPVLVDKEEPATTNKSAINNLYQQQLETASHEEKIAEDASAEEAGEHVVQSGESARQQNEQTHKAGAHAAQAVARQETHKQATAAISVQEKLGDHPEIPFVNDLPWTVINSLPSLNYSSHIYVKGGERKQVVINNQAKDEGQRLDENIQIEKIVKDGVILEYQGYKFKLMALNSWVNI